MAEWDVRSVQFVTASPGPRSEVEFITLPLEGGLPPKLLTNPTRDHPGEWRLIEQEVSDPLVYQRLAPEVSHP